MWGVISAPIFNPETGIVYVGDLHSFRLFGWNILGVVAIMGWSAVTGALLFGSLHVTGLLRVSKEMEIKGNTAVQFQFNILIKAEVFLETAVIFHIKY